MYTIRQSRPLPFPALILNVSCSGPAISVRRRPVSSYYLGESSTWEPEHRQPRDRTAPLEPMMCVAAYSPAALVVPFPTRSETSFLVKRNSVAIRWGKKAPPVYHPAGRATGSGGAKSLSKLFLGEVIRPKKKLGRLNRQADLMVFFRHASNWSKNRRFVTTM